MPDIITQIEGDRGVVTLNRPQALNALSVEMIRGLVQILAIWADDNTVQSVTIRGAGDRAFCAGGDIRAAYHAGAEATTAYMAEEYEMNRFLYHYPKHLTAIMDGIVMGGGFGVAGPCKTRMATDKTIFAMPEVGIGLFPDVGSTYFLSRCPGETGTYLAVTGSSVGPADMLYAGLATAYEGQAPSILKGKRSVIDECFAFDSVEEILDALRAHPDPWARGVADVIATRSPTSLKISLAHVRRAKTMSFDDVLKDDLRIVSRVLRGPDFYEGVRAAVIDKDKKPRWNPDRLEDVSDATVQSHFNL